MTCIAKLAALPHSVRMFSKQVGQNIKAARKARGMSLQKLAAKVEPSTSYQHLSRLEKGGDALNLEWVERIAKALGVPPLELVAPEASRQQQAFTLDEQVANEIARTLAEVALQGGEPESGTVQAIALMLQELTVTFAAHPEAAGDVGVVRPLLTLVGTRSAPAAS